MQKAVLIAGAGGFIGGHLASHLLRQGIRVRCVDSKPLSEWFQLHDGCENFSMDLQLKENCDRAVIDCHEVYNLACNMGGMGFIESNKALCMISVLINTHLLMACKLHQVEKYFFASSACVYPDRLQSERQVTALKEDSVYPAMPEDGYGWEKLFSERMCRHFYEDFQIEVRIARFHNVYGPHGEYEGGREKAPAAICRKVAESIQNGSKQIEVWGDGEQTRSFIYIDDCIEGIQKLMGSHYREPINIGRDDLVSINQLIDCVSEIAGVSISRQYKLDAPQGVRGRNSDNTLVKSVLNWEPKVTLEEGLNYTYQWIKGQME